MSDGTLTPEQFNLIMSWITVASLIGFPAIYVLVRMRERRLERQERALTDGGGHDTRPPRPDVSHAFVSDTPMYDTMQPVVTDTMTSPVIAPVGAHDRGVLPLDAWLRRVNDEPDWVPHIAATGGTGAGKTTLVEAILQTRPGRVYILSPKADDDWGGLPFVTIDDDLTFKSIGKAAKQIDTEIKERWLAIKNAKRAKQSVPEREWLTIVIDDYPYLQRKIDGLADAVLTVARMGRSMRIRLILLAQEASVKAWGIEGEGESRSNFVFVNLVEAHWLNGGATIARWGKEPEQIDTSHVWQYANKPIDPRRWWGPSQADRQTPALYVPPVLPHQDATDSPQTVVSDGHQTVTQTPAQTVQTDELTPVQRDRVIAYRDMQSKGWGRDRARNAGFPVDNNLWALARERGDE